MTQTDDYLAHRPLLFSIAYRMLGSVAEAEDIVQEAFLRWNAADTGAVRSPKAYLASTVTRLCIDHLRSARVRREEYVGPWLPEPLLVDDTDPASEVEMSDSLSTAFLVVLEQLSPLERAAFLLREVFGYEYGEIATMLERSEASARQLVHRAKSHVAARRPRFTADPARQREVTERFVAACSTGDLDELMRLLTDDVVLLSDGGGKVRAAQRPIEGRDKVARFVLGVLQKAVEGVEVALEPVSGGWGVLTRVGGELYGVLTLDLDGDQVQAVHILVNPDKLAALTRTPS